MSDAFLLAPDALLILLGFLLCRHTSFDRPVWDVVERLVYYLLFPVLLFTSVIRSPLSVGVTGAMALAGAMVVLGGIAMSYALARVPGVDARLHASGAQVAFRFNSYVALALSERLLGAQGLSWMAVLVATCVPICNFGAVYPLARQGGQRFWREIARNPLILATSAGLVANLLGLSVPEPFSSAAHKLGQAGLPLGLLAVGAGLRLGELKAAPGLAGALLGIKHLGLPLIALGAVMLLGLEPGQAAIVVAFASMPTASSCYVLAVRMGGAGSFVAGLVTLSTIAGMVTIPFWLGVLRSIG